MSNYELANVTSAPVLVEIQVVPTASSRFRLANQFCILAWLGLSLADHEHGGTTHISCALAPHNETYTYCESTRAIAWVPLIVHPQLIVITYFLLSKSD